MKEKIILYAGKIYNEAFARFFALELRWRLACIVIAGAFLLFLFGPVSIVMSARGLLEENGLLAAKALVRSVGAENAMALYHGNDVLYTLDSVMEDPGVNSSFLTDSSGLIVAPASRFHEDARKEPVIKKALKENDLAVVKKGRTYELAAPVLNGKQVLGVAMISFSPTSAMPWAGVFMFFKELLLFSLIASGMIYAIFRLLQMARQVSKTEHIIEEPKIKFANCAPSDQHSFSDNIISPVVFFDKTFRVNHANKAADMRFKDVTDKHLADLGREYMEIAEELELHQAESIEKNGIKMWRILDGGETKGYGLTFKG